VAYTTVRICGQKPLAVEGSCHINDGARKGGCIGLRSVAATGPLQARGRGEAFRPAAASVAVHGAGGVALAGRWRLVG